MAVLVAVTGSLGGSGCRQPEFASTNIAARPGAAPLAMADVKAGKLTVTSGPESIGPLQQAVTDFLTTAQGYNASVLVHYSGDPWLPGCADHIGNACLNNVLWDPSYNPDFIPELVKQTPWPTIPSLFVSGMGISVGDLSVVDAFLPPSGTLTIYSGDPPAIEQRWAGGFAGAEAFVNEELVFQESAGLFFPFTLDFQGVTTDLSCACTSLSGTEITASHPIVADTCDKLVSKGFCLMFGGLMPGNDQCLLASVHVKVNRVPFSIGLVPELPAPAGTGSWTSSLFPGAKDFHVQGRFRVRPVVATTLSVFATVEDNAAVDADTSHDIALSADVVCGFNSGVVCDTAAVLEGEGYSSCDEWAAVEAEKKLRKQVREGLATALLQQLHPLLTYGDDDEPGELGEGAARHCAARGARRRWPEAPRHRDRKQGAAAPAAR
ncbi:MAG: hypothetical protein HY744_31820 [Deltaproteobacteria bacterium]|nr:hypothetical protein [Deltaproteobacteria bacterium]